APAERPRASGAVEVPSRSRLRGGRQLRPAATDRPAPEGVTGDADDRHRGGPVIRGLEGDRAGRALVPEVQGGELVIEDAMRRAAEILRDADEVALACHINPDPDALGSMLGLSAFLRARGASTVCSFPNDPFEVSGWLGTFDATEALVEPSRFPEAPALMVTCDCASLD